MMDVSREKLNDEAKRTILVWLICVVFLAFIYFTTFVINISKSINSTYSVGWTEVIANILMIILAAVLSIKVRRLLEQFK